MDKAALEKEFAGYLRDIRRWFHAHPELSGKEFGTAERIRSELSRLGIPHRPCGKKYSTGTIAEIRGGRPGRRTILLRADIDALPVTEATGLPYASEAKGVMHACGHECHIANLLAAAAILQKIRNEIPGTVRILFQPAEETAGGAEDMIADGALEGVDAAFGMHVWSELESGTASLLPGARMGATDKFRVILKGRSGHAALPQNCRDATVAMASFIRSAQTVISRETDPLSPTVVTIGKARSGTRWNVISGEAVLEGTVRSLDEKSRSGAEEALWRLSRDTALAFGCEAEFTYERLCDIVINDPSFTELARAAAVEVLGEGSLVDSDRPTMVGEDFGAYSSKAKTAFALLGIRNEACGAVHGQHSDHYRVDEDALIKGAMLHVVTAMKFLEGGSK